MVQARFSAFYLYYLIELSDNPMDEDCGGPNLNGKETVL